MVRLTGPLSRIYSGPMTGTDFLQLSPAAAPVRGLTGWLADAIRAAIMDGRLRAGTPLPATRLLAGDLGVSRGVIVEAYQRLADEGLVSARPGAGTRVLGVWRPFPAAPGPPQVPPDRRGDLGPATCRSRADRAGQRGEVGSGRTCHRPDRSSVRPGVGLPGSAVGAATAPVMTPGTPRCDSERCEDGNREVARPFL